MRDGFQTILGHLYGLWDHLPIQGAMRNELAQLNSRDSLKCSQEEETFNSGYVVGGKIVRTCMQKCYFKDSQFKLITLCIF